MTRSLIKGAFCDAHLLKKVLNAKKLGSQKPIQTYARSSTILPEFVGQTFEVHNGKKFHKVYITSDMVGHKLGEFSLTRTFYGHTSADKKQRGAK